MLRQSSSAVWRGLDRGEVEASGGNTNPSSAFGTFSPLTRGEGRSIDSAARILNRAPFAPAIAGEKVPKADEGAGACATPARDDEVVLDHRRFHAVNRR